MKKLLLFVSLVVGLGSSFAQDIVVQTSSGGQTSVPLDNVRKITVNPDASLDKYTFGNNQGLEDVDFCLGLLHSDVINVSYIFELIAELAPYSADYAERRQHIIDTMIKDVEMRSKAKLIDGFIQKLLQNGKTVCVVL